MNAKNKYLLIQILIGTCITNATTYMSLPFLAIFLAKNTQLQPILIGFVVGSASLAAIIGGSLSAYLSDKIGRRILLLISLLGTSLAFFGFYIVSLDQHKALIIVVFSILNFLSGLCLYAFNPVSQAILSDITPLHLRASVFQWRYFAVNIGAVIGPILGIIFNLAATSLSFLIAAIIFLIYAFTIGKSLDKTMGTKNVNVVKNIGNKKFKFTPLLIYFLLYGILYNICYSQLSAPLSQYLLHNYANGIHWFAVSLIANALTIVVFQHPIYRLVKKLTFFYAFSIGVFLLSFSFLLLVLIGKTMTGFVVSVIFTGLSELFVFPLAIQFVDCIAPSHLKGAYFGIANLRRIGFFIGPIAGGWLLSEVGGVFLFIISSIICLLSIIFLLQVKKYLNIFICKEYVNE